MTLQQAVLLNAIPPGQPFYYNNDITNPYIKSDYAPGGQCVCTQLTTGHADILDPQSALVVPAGLKIVPA